MSSIQVPREKLSDFIKEYVSTLPDGDGQNLASFRVQDAYGRTVLKFKSEQEAHKFATEGHLELLRKLRQTKFPTSSDISLEEFSRIQRSIEREKSKEFWSDYTLSYKFRRIFMGDDEEEAKEDNSSSDDESMVDGVKTKRLKQRSSYGRRNKRRFRLKYATDSFNDGDNESETANDSRARNKVSEDRTQLCQSESEKIANTDDIIELSSITDDDSTEESFLIDHPDQLMETDSYFSKTDGIDGDDGNKDPEFDSLPNSASSFSLLRSDSSDKDGDSRRMKGILSIEQRQRTDSVKSESFSASEGVNNGVIGWGGESDSSTTGSNCSSMSDLSDEFSDSSDIDDERSKFENLRAQIVNAIMQRRANQASNVLQQNTLE